MPFSPPLRPDLTTLLGAQSRSVVKRLIVPRRLEQVRQAAAAQAPQPAYWEKVLRELDITYRCAPEELAHVPAAGPAVVVSNHPHGLADGIVLGAALSSVRGDVRFLANSVMAMWEELRGLIFAVNPFGGAAAARANGRGLRQALDWLNQGGMLVIFPSGEVSSFHLGQGKIVEPDWHDTAVRLIRATGAAAVPAFLHGTNSLAFHLAGLVHPALRTILLPRELVKKRGTSIQLAIGSPIAATSLSRFSSDEEAIKYLHWRTRLLAARNQNRARMGRSQPGGRRRLTKPAAVPPALDARAGRAEIEALPPVQTLLCQGEYRVCFAAAEQIPRLLPEIGRLREIAFRHAGEGTGAAVDLDQFDEHYRHVMVWNAERNEVVGAYRMACTDEVLATHGMEGLYTNTLFRFKAEFLAGIDPAIELGRSFVQPSYQRSYAPLLLLWKGITRYIGLHPHYRNVFGPVSISNLYSKASRTLMMSYLRNRHYHSLLAPSVSARHRPHLWFRGLRSQITEPLAGDLDQLSEGVADLEPDGKGIPVLLRQYLNLGGQIIDFNVDRSFSNVLDALVVVDLTQTCPRTLERYMGREGFERFRQWHSGRPLPEA